MLVALLVTAVGCASHTADAPSRGLAPTPRYSATQRSTQLDFRAAEKVVLTYLDAVRSSDASAAAAQMTPYRRAETRKKHTWRSSNAWWSSVQITSVSRPGHYLTHEPTFVRLYAERFGHVPFKLIVLNVAYSAAATAPAGDIDFVVTKDSAKARWLVDDWGGAVFTH